MEPPPPPRAPHRWLRIAVQVAEIATIAISLGALGLWCSIPDTARLADENPPSTVFIDLRRADAEAAGRPFTLHWQWRPLGAISRHLQAAVIYAEDYNFYRHDGIDWHALEHAVSADWNKGAMSVGGSTITQQLAKNLYLSPRRSFVRKLREAPPLRRTCPRGENDELGDRASIIRCDQGFDQRVKGDPRQLSSPGLWRG